MAITKDLWYHLLQRQAEDKSCSHAHAFAFLLKRTQANKAEGILQAMIKSGMLKRERNAANTIEYYPLKEADD